MAMMVPDEMDMEYEIVKCGMCMANEMNVAKREIELLMEEVGNLMLQSINKIIT